MDLEYKSYTFTTFITQQDENGYLRPFGILDLFQQAATLHTDDVGFSANELFKSNLIWVVSKNRLEIIENCRDIRNCVVETWPNNISKLSLNRNYVLKSIDGKIIAKGVSQWCVLNLKNMFLAPLPPNLFNKVLCNENAFNDGFLRIATYKKEELTFCKNIEVLHSFYDKDHHVNNAHYLDWIYDSIDISEIPNCSIQIDYVNQTFLNDIIGIYKKRISEYTYYFAGYSKEKLCFKCILEVKHG